MDESQKLGSGGAGRIISTNDDHDSHYDINDAVNDAVNDDDVDVGEGGEQRSNGWQGGRDHWCKHWHRSKSSFTSVIYPLMENIGICQSHLLIMFITIKSIREGDSIRSCFKGS